MKLYLTVSCLHDVGLGIFSIAAALYITAAVTSLYFANGALSMVLFFIALPAVLVSAVVFITDVVIAERKRRRSAILCISALVMPLLWLLVVLPANRYLETTRHAQTKATFNRLVADIEAIRWRIGRVPANEQELTKLLGRPIPLSAWNDPTHYHIDVSSPVHYRISCLTGDFAGMIYSYDSQNKADGVRIEPF